MNKSDLIRVVATDAGVSQAVAETVINSALRKMTHSLSIGDEVRLHGFGIFSVKERAEREGRNPATGAAVTIPASKSVKFKATKGLL